MWSVSFGRRLLCAQTFRRRSRFVMEDTNFCFMERCCYMPPAPLMSNERVAQLVKTFYPVTNINLHSIKFLGGFDDRIYYVKGLPIDSHEMQEYVFRVMNEVDADHYDAMGKLMHHVSEEGIHVSVPVKPISSTNGYTVCLKKSDVIEKGVELNDDVDYTGMLLTYLPGNVLSKVQPSPKLLYNTGQFVGRLNTAMQKFSHPYFEARHFLRDLKHFAKIRDYMEFADVAEERECFEYVFRCYSEHVQPNFCHFSKSTLHNDLNEDNLVYNETSSKSTIGLIDCFDAVSSYAVFEGAIFIACMMRLDCTNPLEYIKPVISGYLSTHLLNEQEFYCLYYLVACHLTQCTLLALHSCKVFADNPFRYTTLRQSRTALKVLLKTPKQEADKMWRAAQQKSLLEYNHC